MLRAVLKHVKQFGPRELVVTGGAGAAETDDVFRIAGLIVVEAEGATLTFSEDGIIEIAKIAALVNDRMENIGARRLHTVMEKLLDNVSFDAPVLTE